MDQKTYRKQIFISLTLFGFSLFYFLSALHLKMGTPRNFKRLSSLRHPNIVSVIDYGFNLVGQAFFTMELLQGYNNIVDLCVKMPLHQRLAILGNVLHALAYLHRRNVVHRELKNSNVLVKNGEKCLSQLDL